VLNNMLKLGMKRLTPQEEQLLKRIIEKDEQALYVLYHTYEQPIYRFVKRQLADRNVAQEVTQEIFYDFIEKLRDFRGESSIKTFLFSIARYKVIDVIRKKKIKQVLFSAIPSYVVEGLAAVFMDDEIEKKELAQKIEQVFQRLPNDYALVLRLKYVEGTKVQAIAEKLSLSFKATESLIFRARHAFIKQFHGNSTPGKQTT